MRWMFVVTLVMAAPALAGEGDETATEDKDREAVSGPYLELPQSTAPALDSPEELKSSEKKKAKTDAELEAKRKAAEAAAEKAKKDKADAKAKTRAPAAVTPAPPPPPDPPPEEGMSNLSASLMQYGLGVCISGLCCGGSGVASFVLAIIGIVPYVGWLFWIGSCCVGVPGALAAPAGGISSGVWLREWLGTRRGPWAWSVLAGYAVELVAVAVIVGGMVMGNVLFATFIASIPGPGVTQIANFQPVDEPLINAPLQWAWGNAGAGAGVIFGAFLSGMAGAILGPAGAGLATYHLMGEEKESYDTGFRTPGIFAPNHPEYELQGDTSVTDPKTDPKANPDPSAKPKPKPQKDAPETEAPETGLQLQPKTAMSF